MGVGGHAGVHATDCGLAAGIHAGQPFIRRSISSDPDSSSSRPNCQQTSCPFNFRHCTSDHDIGGRYTSFSDVCGGRTGTGINAGSSHCVSLWNNVGLRIQRFVNVCCAANGCSAVKWAHARRDCAVWDIQTTSSYRAIFVDPDGGTGDAIDSALDSACNRSNSHAPNDHHHNAVRDIQNVHGGNPIGNTPIAQCGDDVPAILCSCCRSTVPNKPIAQRRNCACCRDAIGDIGCNTIFGRYRNCDRSSGNNCWCTVQDSTIAECCNWILAIGCSCCCRDAISGIRCNAITGRNRSSNESSDDSCCGAVQHFPIAQRGDWILAVLYACGRSANHDVAAACNGCGTAGKGNRADQGTDIGNSNRASRGRVCEDNGSTSRDYAIFHTQSTRSFLAF